MEISWIVETDSDGRERLVAHWVTAETPELTAQAA